MDRSSRRLPALFLIVVLTVAIATGWFATASGSPAHATRANAPHGAIRTVGHDALSADVAEGHSHPARPMAATGSVAGTIRPALAQRSLVSRLSDPPSTAVGLLSTPLRI
jgi:hypothetical protein